MVILSSSYAVHQEYYKFCFTVSLQDRYKMFWPVPQHPGKCSPEKYEADIGIYVTLGYKFIHRLLKLLNDIR